MPGNEVEEVAPTPPSSADDAIKEKGTPISPLRWVALAVGILALLGAIYLAMGGGSDSSAPAAASAAGKRSGVRRSRSVRS